jgi:hypothetical protein
MLLTRPEGELFFHLHRSLMCFVNERLQIVPRVRTPEEFAALPDEKRYEHVQRLLDDLDLIERFVDANPAGLADEELAIVHSWRHLVAAKFFVFRQLSRYAVFISCEDPAVVYGVVALSQPLEELVGPRLPVMVETVLLPFRDKIVYDGMLGAMPMSFGGGIRRMLNETCRKAKARQGIVTRLPAPAVPEAPSRPRAGSPCHDPKPRRKASGGADVRPVLEETVDTLDAFCREHLNDEYAAMCRTLAEKLARKRPSPLLKGRPNAWACAIVRTIGGVNFLHDPSQTPHMRTADIDRAFGVGTSTAGARATEIRRMLKIYPCDPRWTLPSRIDDNPLVWMMEVNGLLMDIRWAPREAQEIAFQKGLIPYIPADREGAEGEAEQAEQRR